MNSDRRLTRHISGPKEGPPVPTQDDGSGNVIVKAKKYARLFRIAVWLSGLVIGVFSTLIVTSFHAGQTEATLREENKRRDEVLQQHTADIAALRSDVGSMRGDIGAANAKLDILVRAFKPRD